MAADCAARRRTLAEKACGHAARPRRSCGGHQRRDNAVAARNRADELAAPIIESRWTAAWMLEARPLRRLNAGRLRRRAPATWTQFSEPKSMKPWWSVCARGAPSVARERRGDGERSELGDRARRSCSDGRDALIRGWIERCSPHRKAEARPAFFRSAKESLRPAPIARWHLPQ